MAGPISTWIRDAATGVGRRVREPAVPAATSDAAAASFATLTRKLDYLEASDIKRVREAYRFADEAHLGQFRASGEPYITHPIAVAGLCAEWKLDAQAIMFSPTPSPWPACAPNGNSMRRPSWPR